MPTNRIRRFLGRWFKTALLTFVVLVAAHLLLVFFLLVFQVPSFEIGYSNFWLLRWQNPPGVTFALTWNIVSLLIIAAVMGFIRVLLPTKQSLH